MKAAMWGVGLIVLGSLGLLLINLFGNITVTNQFNYTTMKNAVQASMLDSLDIAHYRAGFCLCTTDGSAINATRTFTDKNEYEFRDIIDDKCVNATGESMNNCVALYGEYLLNRDKFEKNFAERFANVKTNDKEYEYVIKEIIEYPPKVSIRVVSKDEEFIPTDKSYGGYNIVNQIDAIIETNGKVSVVTLAKVEYTITTHHYLEGTTTKVHVDDKISLEKGQEYKTSYYPSDKLSSTYKDKYSWNGKTPTNATGTATQNTEVIYYYSSKSTPSNPTSTTKYTITTHHYIEGTTTKVHADDTKTVEKNKDYTTSYYATDKLSSSYKNKYAWNGKTPTNAKGKATKNTEVTYYYKKTTSTSTSDTGCGWHYLGTKIKCKKYKTSQVYGTSCPSGCTTKSVPTAPSALKNCICSNDVNVDDISSAPGTYNSAAAAKNACEKNAQNACGNNGTYISSTCNAVRNWSCSGETGTYTLKNQTSSPGNGCRCLG